MNLYEARLTEDGHKQRTETLRRVRSFLRDVMKLPLRALTGARCASLYASLREREGAIWVGSGAARKLKSTGKPLSVDSQRGMYTHAKTFLKFCVEQKWIKVNPLADVKPRGKLVHGKPQMTIDEARRWYAAAMAQAEKEAGALAAVTALLLGLRATEITRRQVRDLDDGGRILRIPESKTKAGRRLVEVPEPLRVMLVGLARGRDGGELLFGAPHLRGWVLFWTKKICRLAKVPEVCAHSLRGSHASLALAAGATSHLVAGALGHASDAVTLGSYAVPGAQAAGRTKAALGVLTGGRRK